MTKVGSVTFGDDERVGKFVMERTGHPIEGFVALGVERCGALIGGVLFYNYRSHDIEVAIAADHSSWAMPSTLRTLFAYPFHQLGVARMTALIARDNKKSRRFCEALGFKLEGVCRRGFDGKRDAMIYGLLRDECRLLRKR